MKPRSVRTILFLLVLPLWNTSANGQSISAHQLLIERPGHPSTSIASAQSFSVDSIALQKLIASGGHLLITDFPGSYTDRVTLDLKPAHSPIDSRTEFIEGTAGGDRKIVSPSFRVFRGVVLGEPHSRVMLTIYSGNILCSIVRESGESYVLGPSRNEAERGLLLFVKETDLLASAPFNPLNCIADDMDHPEKQRLKQANRTASAPPPLPTLLQTDIAVEADSMFYSAAGAQIDKVLGYIASLFAMSSAIYEDEASITWHLTWVKVWSSGDPYNVKGNAYALEPLVAPYWKAHYANVQRDVAHIMTSIPYGGGGFGYYSLCDTNYSYSMSSPQTGHTYPTFAFTYDAYIVAHELGHNFSLQHTHSCWWAPALDTCYTQDDTIYHLALGDACTSRPVTPRPSIGSIMSYCANANYTLSGNDFSHFQLALTFTPRGDDSLRKFAGLAPCIVSPANPMVILTSPRGSATYRGDTTVALSWSFANLQNVSLEYSSNGGNTWNPIAANVAASSGSLPWKIPNEASEKMLVRIFDAASDTVADTSLLFFTVTKAAGVSATPHLARIAFSLMPDPAGDDISVIPSSDIASLNCEILDARGGVQSRAVGRASSSSGLVLGLRTLAAGTYFLHITSPVDRVIAFSHIP